MSKCRSFACSVPNRKEYYYRDIQVQGLICTVDLFPVPDSFAPSQSSDPQATSPNVCQTPLFSPLSTSPTQSSSFEELSPFRSIHDVDPISSAQLQSQSTDYPNDIFPYSVPSEILHHLGNFPITESTKRTQALAGATFVQAFGLEHQGKKAILFPFSVRALFPFQSCV